ncbi:MAG: hypothetical protein A3F17_09230 [Gammaproteobacteria bacterium RIFCSPHIGHO2_12_FULL_41_15]|nr:MAG: hypothetical protein A3F17_09230 [Gammaproteobacteria bacterium RIFCSPHIGHO2_12_FULL_41_15]
MKVAKESNSNNDRDLWDVYHSAVSYYEAKLELFERMASSEQVKQYVQVHLHGLATAGLIVDFTAAYYNNPYPHIPNEIYASTTVLSDLLKDHLTKLSLIAVLGEETTLALLPPATILLGSMQVIDAFYPELSQILEEERRWYEGLTTAQRQTALEAMQTIQISDSYGLTLTLQGLLKITHGVMDKVKAVGQWGASVLGPALRDWASSFTPEDFWHLADHGESVLATMGQPIENAFELASMTSAVMSNTGLPFEVAQSMVAYSFLHDSSLSEHVSDEWVARLAEQPDVSFSRESMDALLDEMDKRINANPVLQAMKKQLDDLAKDSLDAKIERLQQQADREVKRGYEDALQLGGTIAQFGQLVNSKTLVQAGRVFQEGVHILQGLQALGKLSGLETFGKTLSSLNLGPVSMIASAVMSIISLFHASGPSQEEIIIKQLNQLQKGINQVLQNQVIILDAINQSYVNLLNAIQVGVAQLAALMQSEFREVEREFYVLSHQLDYYTQQILNELTRLEFSIKQNQLAPLKSAIKAAENFNRRYPNAKNPLYESEVRHTLGVLEEWGSETICDPSFTGNVETDYSQAIRDPDAIYRHFPSNKNEITMQDIMLQSGFLLGIFNYLVPNGNDTTIQACNMNLWMHILSVYNKMLPHAMTFPYDVEGHLIQKMLEPANHTRKMVGLFQRQAFLLMSKIQERMDFDIQAIVTNCETDLLAIKAGLKQNYQNVLRKQRELLPPFIENICTMTTPYNHVLSIDVCNLLKNVVMQYDDNYGARMNAPILDLKKPFSAFMFGNSITAAHNPYSPYPVKGLLNFAFPNVTIPSTLTKAELLGNGQIIGDFVCSPAVWNEGNLQCMTTLRFSYTNGTQFTVSEMLWSGWTGNYHPLHYAFSVMLLNNMPLFPWNSDCTPVLPQGYDCVHWSHELSYSIDPFDPNVRAVAELNQLVIAERVAALQIMSAFQPQGKFAYLYKALESKWRLYRAFALAMGIAPNSIRAMNEFNIMNMLAEEIAAIRDYDVETDTEITPLEPRILARFEPFFADVMNQTLAFGHSSQTAPVSNSSLADFIHQIDQSSKLIVAMKRLHQETKALQDQRNFQPLPISQQGACAMPLASVHTRHDATTRQHSWFSWPGFLLGSAVGVVLPVIALMTYGCVLERRGRVQREGGYYELGRMSRTLMYLLNLPGTRSEIVVAACGRPDDTSLIPALKNAWQEEEAFYYGGWDNGSQLHAHTGMPIFTYRTYRDGVEMGSAQFYRHPLLCRSPDGTRHNVIRLSGIFRDYDELIDPQHIDEVCESLPPTVLDNFEEGIYSGVQHGVLRGSSRLVEQVMVQQGYSHRAAQGVKTACYYFALFAMNTAQYYAEDAAANEPERLQYAAQQAAIETTRVAMTACVINVACNTMSWAASKARESGWQRTAGVVDQVSRYAGLSIYAYNGHRRGVAHLAGSVIGGYAAESAVESVGHAALSAFGN